MNKQRTKAKIKASNDQTNRRVIQKRKLKRDLTDALASEQPLDPEVYQDVLTKKWQKKADYNRRSNPENNPLAQG